MKGDGVLDIALREDAQGLAVVLHNLTNPMMLKGPIRAVHPVGRQLISVAIPAGRAFGSARLLVSGREAAATVEGGRVHIEVPGIDQLEVVHLTWR